MIEQIENGMVAEAQGIWDRAKEKAEAERRHIEQEAVYIRKTLDVDDIGEAISDAPDYLQRHLHSEWRDKDFLAMGVTVNLMIESYIYSVAQIEEAKGS